MVVALVLVLVLAVVVITVVVVRAALSSRMLPPVCYYQVAAHWSYACAAVAGAARWWCRLTG